MNCYEFSLFSDHLEEEVVDREKNLMTLMLQGYLEESPMRKKGVSPYPKGTLSKGADVSIRSNCGSVLQKIFTRIILSQ